MCMHDPDSEAIQTANALKLGRQKKIQIVNGEELKVVQTDSEETLFKEEAVEPETRVLKNELGNQVIEGVDGQHYVVLEVIQLQGADGEQAVAVVSESDFQNSMSVDDGGNQYITSDYGKFPCR